MKTSKHNTTHTNYNFDIYRYINICKHINTHNTANKTHTTHEQSTTNHNQTANKQPQTTSTTTQHIKTPADKQIHITQTICINS